MRIRDKWNWIGGREWIEAAVGSLDSRAGIASGISSDGIRDSRDIPKDELEAHEYQNRLLGVAMHEAEVATARTILYSLIPKNGNHEKNKSQNHPPTETLNT
jgi:hypothetical protein